MARKLFLSSDKDKKQILLPPIFVKANTNYQCILKLIYYRNTYFNITNLNMNIHLNVK